MKIEVHPEDGLGIGASRLQVGACYLVVMHIDD
jgi:hypothetical protein